MKVEIEIPVGIMGGIGEDDMRKFCRAFDCELERVKGRAYFVISAENPTDLFWLGANSTNH